jgi:hypothetical protein
MDSVLSWLSTEQVGAVLIVAAVVVAITWFATDLTGASRVVTAGLAGVVTSAAMVAGLYVLD